MTSIALAGERPHATLRTTAWSLVGLIGSLPGTIELTDDQLVFTAHKSGTIWPYQLHKLERCVGRAGPRAASAARRRSGRHLSAVFLRQRHEFAGRRQILRSSFIQPQNTKLPKPRPDAAVESVAEAGLEFLDIALELSAARAAGRAWKKALALE